MLKTVIRELARKCGFGVFRVGGHYAQDGLFTVHSDHFRSDSSFRAAYGRGLEASRGADPGFEWRVHVALWAARTALKTDGDFVECGVNAGFISSAVMRRLNWSAHPRRFYLVDTFTGPVLEQYSQQEIQNQRLAIAQQAIRAGAYVTDLDRVKRNFGEWPNAIVVQGTVPDALTTLPKAIAFLHLDMNCALPEQAALEYCWKLLSPHSIVLLDDYTYYGHDCQREALDTTARSLGAEILSLPTGQGLIVK